MCPLLGCRCRFKDIPSTLNHLYLCPWISDGQYWCHFCSRTETLFGCSEYEETAPPRRKIPILGRLVRFLVPRMRVSVLKPSKVDVPLAAPNRDAKLPSSTPELESIARIIELPANDPRWHYPEAGGGERIELEASGPHLRSSRSAHTSISTSMQTMSQTNGKVEMFMALTAMLWEGSPTRHDWKQRLRANSDLVERYSEASPKAWFEQGIFTLKELIGRRVLNCLEDVLLKSRVLFVFTYILHHHDGSSAWRGFNWDFRHWRRMIVNEFDAGLFSDARGQRELPRDRASVSSSAASFTSKWMEGSSIRAEHGSWKAI